MGEFLSGNADYRPVRVVGDELAWEPQDRSGPSVSGILDRLEARRKFNQARRYGTERSAEELVKIIHDMTRSAMRPDEWLDARCRVGHYTACRKVTTMDRALAREAGL